MLPFFNDKLKSEYVLKMIRFIVFTYLIKAFTFKEYEQVYVLLCKVASFNKKELF